MRTKLSMEVILIDINTVTLWAMWFSAQPKTMQDFNGYCDRMYEGQTLTLQDTRDNNSYTVAKLKDGKCWMTQNLKLGKSQTMKLTPDDSDVLADYQLPASSAPKPNFTNKVYIDNTYGGYYNYYVATADAYRYDPDSEQTYSICPKSWKLPSEKDGKALAEKYTPITIQQAPANFKLGGSYMGNCSSNDTPSTYQIGTIGMYWLSNYEHSDGRFSYYMELYGPTSSYEGRICVGRCSSNGCMDTKNGGNTIRCLARDRSPKITFRAGDGIESIRIATENDPPVTSYPDKVRTIDKYPTGTKLIVTVIPKPGYKLTGWTRSSSSGTLSNNELLTTTYTVGSGDEVLTANGAEGIYQSMQDLADCDATGTNVTDVRDQKSYAVAKIGTKCYMLSDLRLDAGTALDNSTSSTSGSFTVPTEEWTSSTSGQGGGYWGAEPTKPLMKKCDEKSNNCSSTTYNFTVSGYYYNWRAATANTNSTAYSICPKNWSLPDYSTDITAADAWKDGANPAMLSVTGDVYQGYLESILPSSMGYWPSNAAYTTSAGSSLRHYGEYTLTMSPSSNSSVVNRGTIGRYAGVPVRCMLKN